MDGRWVDGQVHIYKFEYKFDYLLLVVWPMIDYNWKTVDYSRVSINQARTCVNQKIGEKVKFMNLSALVPSKEFEANLTIIHLIYSASNIDSTVYTCIASKVKHLFIIYDTLLKTFYFVIFLYQRVCLIHYTIQNAIWPYCSRSMVSCIHHAPYLGYALKSIFTDFIVHALNAY